MHDDDMGDGGDSFDVTFSVFGGEEDVNSRCE